MGRSQNIRDEYLLAQEQMVSQVRELTELFGEKGAVVLRGGRRAEAWDKRFAALRSDLFARGKTRRAAKSDPELAAELKTINKLSSTAKRLFEDLKKL